MLYPFFSRSAGVKARVAASAVAVATLTVSTAATAQSLREPQVTFNAAVASDYSTRGISQTNGKPVIQGGFDVNYGNFYVGSWASNVDFGDGTKAEIDIYTGVRTQYRGTDLDLRAVGYIYAGQPDGAKYNYMEIRAEAARQIGKTRVGVVVNYAPDYFGVTTDDATYLLGTVAYAPRDRWTVSGGVGHQWVPSGRDHTMWNVGTTYQATERLAVDVRYYDTDGSKYGKNYDSRVVLALKTNF